MASRKQAAFNRSMAAMIGSAGVNMFMDRVDGQTALTNKVLDAQQELIEAQDAQIRYLGQLVVELIERVELIEGKVAA